MNFEKYNYRILPNKYDLSIFSNKSMKIKNKLLKNEDLIKKLSYTYENLSINDILFDLFNIDLSFNKDLFDLSFNNCEHIYKCDYLKNINFDNIINRINNNKFKILKSDCSIDFENFNFNKPIENFFDCLIFLFYLGFYNFDLPYISKHEEEQIEKLTNISNFNKIFQASNNNIITNFNHLNIINKIFNNILNFYVNRNKFTNIEKMNIKIDWEDFLKDKIIKDLQIFKYNKKIFYKKEFFIIFIDNVFRNLFNIKPIKNTKNKSIVKYNDCEYRFLSYNNTRFEYMYSTEDSEEIQLSKLLTILCAFKNSTINFKIDGKLC